MFRVLTSPRASVVYARVVVAPWVVLAGLTLTNVGCTSDAPPIAPSTPESEKSTLQKVGDKAVDLEHKAVDATGSAVKATGNAIEKVGEKLETSAAESVRENVGQKAGDIVEGTGKALEKAGTAVDKGGDKLKGSVAPK